MQKHQDIDPVIRQLKSWHIYKTKPIKPDDTVPGKNTLLRHLRKFHNTSIKENTNFLEYQTSDFKVPSLPLSLILLEFHISHSLNTKGHAGSEKTNSNFFRNCYFSNASVRIKVICNGYITCQLNKPYPHQKQFFS